MNEKQRTTSTEFHTLTAAKVLLFEAGKQNPGPWIRHSEFVAEAAGKIASQCPQKIVSSLRLLDCYMILAVGMELHIWHMFTMVTVT